MICVSIQEKEYSRCKEILSNCQMAELRGDLCKFSTNQIADLVSSHPNILFTCRIENSSIEYAKEQICTAIKRGAKYVDIEIEAPIEFLDYIKAYARANGCKLIISYHNFTETPSLNYLQGIYNLCRRKGADIVKIVTTANTLADATNVMQLYRYNIPDKELVKDNYLERGEESGSLSNSFGNQEAELVAFCMGEIGKFTRKLALDLGAPYTYVSYDNFSATANGQYTKAEMESLLNCNNYPYNAYKNTATIFNNPFPELNIPCSKSIAQRAILAAALSNNTTTLYNYSPCNDITGAIKVIEELGCKVESFANKIVISNGGIERLKEISTINVGESGLLTRLLTALSLVIKKGETFTIDGCGSLKNRDLSESIIAIKSSGADIESNNNHIPLTIKGCISNNTIEFSGEKSSQIVSGFLMALPLLKENTTLIINNPTSTPYIELTIMVLKQFGISISTIKEKNKIIYNIKGKQSYKGGEIYLESDWSSAAYFAVAGALSKGVILKDIKSSSLQADEAILDILRYYGTDISISNTNNGLSNITISPLKFNKQKVEYNLTNSPDLFPIVALLGSINNGTTILKGVERLYQKESNRAQSLFSELIKIGGNITIEEDFMHIRGPIKENKVNNIKIDTYNDHRIAMTLYIAGALLNKEMHLNNIECINKSFPMFLNLLLNK